jgi:hypothetical protein
LFNFIKLSDYKTRFFYIKNSFNDYIPQTITQSEMEKTWITF